MRYLIFALALMMSAATGAQQKALRLIGKVPLPGVEGRIDHLSVDTTGRRLFVAALGNNTIEVVDIDLLKRVASIQGFDEPQGIRHVAASNTLLVANGGTGAVDVIDPATRRVLNTVKLSGDADNVRLDATSGLAYVGYGSGALAVLDPRRGAIADIPLGGHPESFQLEAGSAGRIFVNVPSLGRVAVVDRGRRTVIATWPVTAARDNYPMALDDAHHRVFLGCRAPARLLIYDTESGKMVASASIAGDTDDLFYDSRKRLIYVAGGGGAITVIEQTDADRYRPIETIATAPGARTALFAPDLRRLFLAVPHRGSQPAAIWIYAAS
jgi:DNA-binding beta-propeller fold protein YncE